MEAFEDTYLQYGASEIHGSRDPYHAETQRYNDRFISQSIRRHNKNRHSLGHLGNRYDPPAQTLYGRSSRQGDNEIIRVSSQYNPNHGNYFDGTRQRRNVIHPGNLNLVDMFSRVLQHLAISQDIIALCPLMRKP